MGTTYYRELDSLISRRGKIQVKDGLYIRVIVIDARKQYGRVDVKVRPLIQQGGQGSAWFSTTSINWEKEAEDGEPDAQPDK